MILGFHEEIGEGWVRPLHVRIAENDLAVARQLELAFLARVVCDCDASYFSCILGNDRDLRARLDVAIHAQEGDAIGREHRAIPLRLGAGWLVRGGPRAAASEVLHVDEASRVVARAVRPPARDGQLFVPAVARAAVGHHDRVREVAQQRDFRSWSVGGRDLANRRSLHLGAWQRLIGRRLLGFLEHQPTRHALVQQHVRRAHQRICVEAAEPYPVEQRIRERHETHPGVVRHVVVHHGEGVPGLRPREIERIAETVDPQRSARLQPREVVESVPRRDHRRERSRVRGNHQVAPESALEREIGHAEGAVLIGEMAVAKVVRALADPPWHAALVAVCHLTAHHAAIALGQERERIRAHHERRHQILEHAPAPRHQRRFAGCPRERPPKVEPVGDRDVVLRDRDEAREAGLGCEEIVVRLVERVVRHLVSDGEQLARIVVQKIEVHSEGELVRALRDLRQPATKVHVVRPGRDAEARLPQSDEVTGEIPAVDRGDVRRLQYAQVARVVPVVEVTSESRQPVERSEHRFEATRHLLDRDEVEVAGTHRRQELEADVGG